MGDALKTSSLKASSLKTSSLKASSLKASLLKTSSSKVSSLKASSSLSLRARSKRVFALLVASGMGAALALAPDTARAGDTAAAESLFQRGVELLKKDDWTEACKAFEASMKLDASVGAQINIARCAAHDGKIATAWAGFRKAKALNAETPLERRKASVESFVDGEIKKLEPRIPYVTVKVTLKAPASGGPKSPSDVADLKILRDDVPIPLESTGVEIPVDPGKHVFRASAPGYLDTHVELDVPEASKKDVSLELEAAPTAPKPLGTTDEPRPKGVVEPPPRKTTSPLVGAGIGVAAVGAAALVVSAATGGVALSDRKKIDHLVEAHHCTESGGDLKCDAASDAEAHSATTRGKALALTSTVTLFAGAALAGTGIVMAVVGATSSKKSRGDVSVTPVVGPSIAGLSLGGAF
jgi:hypothetical protein